MKIVIFNQWVIEIYRKKLVSPLPTPAIKYILRNNQKEWTFPEIVYELNKTGVNSKSKSLASSVSSALRGFEKTDNIIITGIKRKRKYRWSDL